MRTNRDLDVIEQALVWLTDFGFELIQEEEHALTYRAGNIEVIAHCWPIDGFGLDVRGKSWGKRWEYSVPGVHHAICTLEGRPFVKVELNGLNSEESMREVLAFLKGRGRKLLRPSRSLRLAACRVRFWHVGDWVSTWGTTIVMSDRELRKCGRVVPELVRLLDA
jgi:hypothetical protein